MFIKRFTTFRTFFFGRFVPRSKLTLRIICASVEHFSCFSFAFDKFAATIRTGNTNSFQNRFSVATIGETGTSLKYTKTPLLIHHHSTAFFARHITYFYRCFSLGNFYFRFFQILCKRFIEFTNS